MVKILKYPDPVIKKETRNVNTYDVEDDSFFQQVAEMFSVMRSNDGAGLAAPQVGDLRRFFLLGIPDISVKKGKQITKVDKFELCINPEILEESIEDVAMTEGCLSVPGISDIPIYRPERIYVRYYDNEFRAIEVELTGWASRVFQHEFDHLNGKLFIDRMTMDQRKSIMPKLVQMRSEWKAANKE